MRNRFVVACVAGWMLGVGAVFGQISVTPPASALTASHLTFDVATVKPSAPLDMAKMAAQIQAGQMPKIGPHVDASRAEYSYMSLKDLIALAYKVKAYQITGPAWLAIQRFDIVATMPNGASKDDAPAMLQALLQERFKLVAHRDTQEHPVLALVVGKGGPKLKESSASPAPIDENAPLKPREMKMDTVNGPARVTINADGSSTINMGVKGTITQRMDMQTQTLHMESSTVTMAGFADTLTNVLQMGGGGGRQVVDMTELKGNYQVALEISLADIMAMVRAQGMNVPVSPAGGGTADGSAVPTASDPGGGSTVYSSVQALGLKLEQRKAPVEQLVVDRVEKMPTEN
jgi:uncharacterized protein (TIGR03435 family)